MDGEFPTYYLAFDSFDEICNWIESVQSNYGVLDALITTCKAELERRKGILDELAAEAQELKIGY